MLRVIVERLKRAPREARRPAVRARRNSSSTAGGKGLVPDCAVFTTEVEEAKRCQTQAYQIQTCNSQVRMQLNFNHPVAQPFAGNRELWNCEVPVCVAA